MAAPSQAAKNYFNLNSAKQQKPLFGGALKALKILLLVGCLVFAGSNRVNAGQWDTTITTGLANILDWNESPSALVASGNTLYVAIGKATTPLTGEIFKWVNGTGWSVVSNSLYGGKINCMAVVADKLYVGGNIWSVGVNADTAKNIARLNMSSGTWAAVAEGLETSGDDSYEAADVYAITPAEWGGGSSTPLQTKIYVGGNFKNAGGYSANNIARFYEDGSSIVWETLDDGVDGVYDPVKAIAVDSSYFYDASHGKGHIVYVGGNFEKTVNSGTAYNIAAFDEYFIGATRYHGWRRFGSGVYKQYQNPGEDCEVYTNYASTVSGIAIRSWDKVYLVGGFTRANSSGWWFDYCQPLCQVEQGLGFARIISASSLGTWDDKQSWTSYSYTCESAAGNIQDVAAYGNHVYVACDMNGSIITSGGNTPGGLEDVSNAMYVYGTTWTDISLSESSKLVAFEKVSASSAGGFFMGNNKIYRYVP